MTDNKVVMAFSIFPTQAAFVNWLIYKCRFAQLVWLAVPVL